MKTTTRELLTLAAACVAVPAFAQNAAQPSAEGAQQTRAAANARGSDNRDRLTRGLEEVIVTATKREERLLDVPISIAVIDAQDIERRGVIGMEDYLRSIPGVNQIDNGTISNAIIIRGINTSPVFENFASGTTVGSYFDETPITGAAGLSAGGIDVRPVDIERIEVLRGPQGTAYGSSSLSGTLRMIPVRPKLDGFSARLTASYSDTSGRGSDNSMIQGVLNVPVIADKFALRMVGYRYDESGFYRNVAGVDPTMIAIYDQFGSGDLVRGYGRDDEGRMVSTGGRVVAFWQVTDKLDLSLHFLTQKIEQDGQPVGTVGKFERSAAPVAPQARSRGETGDVLDTNIDLVNLVLNYDLGWSALTSAVSWVEGGWEGATDSSLNFRMPVTFTAPSDFQSFTAETRLTSQFAGRFQFLGGLFYEDIEDLGPSQTIYWSGTPGTNPFGLDPRLGIFDYARERDQRAVFGEVSYDLTDKLTAMVGGRYFKYEKDDRILTEGNFFRVPFGTGVAQIRDSSEDGSSFKASLSYKPTQDSLLYASWAEGFRLGRPDAGALPAACDANGDGVVDGTNATIESTRTIHSDFLENYEIGAKVALFNRRVVIDTAIYHIDWDGMPVRVAPMPGTICNFVANAGAATSDGVEFQASVFVGAGVRLDIGGGYTRAELSEAVPAQGWPDGARLPGSPEVTANLAAQYDFEVAGYKAFVRADSLYTGEFYSAVLSPTVTALGRTAGDYTKVDARAGVAINRLSVEFFVRNVTDEDAITWPGGPRFPNGGYRLRPRTIGIQLGYDFE